jgi:hypothetical protein
VELIVQPDAHDVVGLAYGRVELFWNDQCQRHWGRNPLWSELIIWQFEGQSRLDPRGRVPSLFMTAPENMQNLPRRLPGLLPLQHSEWKKAAAISAQYLMALACTTFRRKDCPVLRPFGGNGGFGVPEAVQRGRPLFFWWSMHRGQMI